MCSNTSTEVCPCASELRLEVALDNVYICNASSVPSCMRRLRMNRDVRIDSTLDGWMNASGQRACPTANQATVDRSGENENSRHRKRRDGATKLVRD